MSSQPPHPVLARPRFLDDEAFCCLRSGELARFHQIAATRPSLDFSGADLRGADLRQADLSKVVLRNCYLRDTDLRGQDLSHMDLSGCSLFHAKVSGTLFPADIPAEEIRLSLDFGTRLRKRL